MDRYPVWITSRKMRNLKENLMNITEFRDIAAKADRNNLEAAAVYLYKQISRSAKARIEQDLIGYLEGNFIQNTKKPVKKKRIPFREEKRNLPAEHDQDFSSGQTALNQVAQDPDTANAIVAVEDFMQKAKCGLFFTEDSALMTREAIRYRKDLSQAFQKLQECNPESSDFIQAGLVLKALYKMLCQSCVDEIVPVKHPFRLVGISQREYFHLLCMRYLTIDSPDDDLLEILLLSASSGLDSRTLHSELFLDLETLLADWALRSRCLLLVDRKRANLPFSSEICWKDDYEQYMAYKQTVNLPVLELFLMAKDPYGLDHQILAFCLDRIEEQPHQIFPGIRTGNDLQSFSTSDSTLLEKEKHKAMESELFILLRCLVNAERDDLFIQLYDSARQKFHILPREMMQSYYSGLLNQKQYSEAAVSTFENKETRAK